MKMIYKVGALALALAAPLVPAQAATIQVISGDQRSFIPSAYGPAGQSFTAIDSNLTSFGFQFTALNPDSPSVPFVFTLRDGAGLTGAIIATRTFTPPASINSRTPTWFDFDITGTTVNIGSIYTAVLTSNSVRNGIVMGPNINIQNGQELSGDAYAGGRAFFTTEVYPNCAQTGNCDLNFRVSGTSAVTAVPEPATWLSLILGFGAIGGGLRRRARALNRLTTFA